MSIGWFWGEMKATALSLRLGGIFWSARRPARQESSYLPVLGDALKILLLIGE